MRAQGRREDSREVALRRKFGSGKTVTSTSGVLPESSMHKQHDVLFTDTFLHVGVPGSMKTSYMTLRIDQKRN